MRFTLLLMPAILAFTSVATHAEMISVRDNNAVITTTVLRGAPHRCHGNKPVLIKVQGGLQRSKEDKQVCAHAKHDASKVTTVTNIFIIARRREPVYIKIN